MIHYHGTPLTPESVAATVLKGLHAFVSFADPRAVGVASAVCQSFALDNGAFSAWRAGTPVTDWRPFYEWVGELRRHPACDFAIIPDVIDGTAEDNDALLREWPHGVFGVPAWHLHEPIERLERLAADWPRVAFGSSGDYSDPGSLAWWGRMADALRAVCDADGRPLTKLHGLRMLDPALFSRIPFASADSTNVCRNTSIDCRWAGPYEPATQEARGIVLVDRIEAFNGAVRWAGRPTQHDLFGRVA